MKFEIFNMKQENRWKGYWKERISQDKDYFGKESENADEIISLLDIKERDFILDIGCGNGSYLSDIKNKIKNSSCFGIEISKDAINLCKDKRIKLVLGDMEDIPFEDEKFDKVFSLGVIEHTNNTQKVIKEIARVTKPDGIILITIPNKFSFFHITKNYKMLIGTWDIGIEKSFTIHQLSKLLKKEGLTLTYAEIRPHFQIANIFNYLDNKMNKINNKLFGFFIWAIAKKE